MINSNGGSFTLNKGTIKNSYLGVDSLNKLEVTSKNSNVKRNDYIKWDELFMGIAILASKRSKDPSTQVGVCLR